MTAIYLTKDLVFSSRVTSAAADCGLEMSVVEDPSRLESRIEAGGVHMVLFDLTMPDLHLLTIVPRIRDRAPFSISIIAFGPHVDVAGLAAARQAGCDDVYSRGQFNSQMTEILRKHGCAV